MLALLASTHSYVVAFDTDPVPEQESSSVLSSDLDADALRGLLATGQYGGATGQYGG